LHPNRNKLVSEITNRKRPKTFEEPKMKWNTLHVIDEMGVKEGITCAMCRTIITDLLW